MAGANGMRRFNKKFIQFCEWHGSVAKFAVADVLYEKFVSKVSGGVHYGQKFHETFM